MAVLFIGPFWKLDAQVLMITLRHFTVTGVSVHIEANRPASPMGLNTPRLAMPISRSMSHTAEGLGIRARRQVFLEHNCLHFKLVWAWMINIDDGFGHYTKLHFSI